MPEKFSVLAWLKNSLIEGFPKSVRKNRYIIISVSVVFFVAIGIAFFAHQIGNNVINKFLINRFDLRFPTTLLETPPYLELVGSVLRVNLSLASASIILGPALGIFPLFTILNSGLSIGFSMANPVILALRLFSARFSYIVFEWPGIILSVSCGVMLGIGSLKSVIRRETEPFKNAGEDVIHLILPSFLLIVIGGFLEGFILEYYFLVESPVFIQVGLIGVSFVPLVLIILWMGGKLV